MGVTRGTYVVATSGGVGTTAVDARVDQAGIFTPNGDLGAVPGVLSGCAVTGIASGWAYNVAAGHVVTSRSATDGAVLMAVNGITSTPAPVLADGVTPGSTSAPVSGSRWEIIWIRQRDLDNADADNNAVLGVTQGTASGSPTKPAIPAGALALAESLVLAGAANTASGSVTITNVAAKVGLRGGIVAVANSTQRDLLSSFATATTPVYVDRLDTGVIERNAGSGWVRISTTGWTTYVPTITGMSFGTGTTSFRWRYNGDMVEIEFAMVFGTGAAGTAPRFTLPVASQALNHGFQVAGLGSTNPANAVWPVYITLPTASTAQVNYRTSGALLDISLTAPGTYAVGNSIIGKLSYIPA